MDLMKELEETLKIMEYKQKEQELLNIYIDYIKEKHKDQKRSQGTPYYLHPIAVSNILKRKGCSIDIQIIGLLHDILEDTDTTFEELIHKSSYDIANIVRILSKTKDYNMEAYIQGIKDNEIAKLVKLADRLHNLSEAHMTNLKFQKRYIEETEKYYLDLAKGTIFEDDITREFNQLKYDYQIQLRLKGE